MVATGSKAFTNAEVEAFKSYFSEMVANATGEPFTLSVEKLNANPNYAYDFDMLYIKFTPAHPITETTRNREKDRITCFGGISFGVRKETGFIERWDWLQGKPKDDSYKDYESAPAFQYSASLIIHGNMIEYRHRNEGSISVKGCFDYGTEMTDLDFSKGLDCLFRNTLGGIYPTRSEATLAA